MVHKTNIPIQLLFIEDAGYHLLVKAKVNGKTVTLLIDTGASKTVFDKGRILRFANEESFLTLEKLSTGLGTTMMETQSTVLKKFQVGKLQIANFETIVIDLSHVNLTYAKLDLPAIDGVLGSDLMVKHHAIIDYKKKEMKLSWKK
ncbi:MAG: retropepsin-like aspartic protease [Bacteroidetes bacterium]|nr:retropepsin-like aspartic protease [Bacteroidota bacterium]